MKIGIIGSSGFIGKNLFIFLKKNTNDQIFSFSSYLKNKNSWIKKIIKEIRIKKPDIIINCSANQNLSTSKNNLINMLNSNLYSNILFVDEVFKNKNFKGYISFGSKWELGDTKKDKPLNFYAASKKANDIFFKFYSNNKTSIVSLKIFDTYGINDKRKKFLNDLLSNYKKKKSLNITAGKQYLDYVHIGDISFLVLKIIKDIKSKKLSGFKTFTVSSKKPIRLIDLVKKLQKILNNDLKIKIGKKRYRKNESTNPTLDIFNYPGWKTKYNLISELKNIFDNK
jgi:nucleoside-diphosphate-sugar epimerase